MTGAIEFVQLILERDDLTVSQRREIADFANSSLRGTNVNVTDEVTVVD